MRNTLIILLSFPITLVLYILLFSGNIKYSEEIVVNANIDTVLILLDNPYNMEKYMDGFNSYNVLSGTINKVGTKSKIIVNYIDEGSKEQKIMMIEEIIINNLPEEKKVTYSSKGILNIVNNKLIKISHKF